MMSSPRATRSSASTTMPSQGCVGVGNVAAGGVDLSASNLVHVAEDGCNGGAVVEEGGVGDDEGHNLVVAPPCGCSSRRRGPGRAALRTRQHALPHAKTCCPGRRRALSLASHMAMRAQVSTVFNVFSPREPANSGGDGHAPLRGSR